MGILLSAGLFTDEPVREFVVLNQAEVNAKGVKEEGAYFMLKPVTPAVDIEYQKIRGQDVQSISVTPEQQENGSMSMKFGEIRREISNDRELKAKKFLARKCVFGWEGLDMDNGEELKFSSHNLEIVCCLPQFQPVFDRVYDMTRIKQQVEEGNLET